MCEDGLSKLKYIIKEKKAKVGVIGIGYVGLPFAMLCCRRGFETWGFDIDKSKIKKLEKGISYIDDVSSKEVLNFVKEGFFKPVSDFSFLKEMDVIVITVPTPVDDSKNPDLSFVKRASYQISENMGKLPKLIILKSTTYPGTTEEIILPIIEKKGYKVGKDFYLAFSPERVDPGNKKYPIEKIPVVVGGITQSCRKISEIFYKHLVNEVKVVSSPKVAEMSKLLENLFRNVNIALVNEIAQLCDRMKLSVWEVIEAASTKPFGFMPFYPGPGVGGHCIPVDPHYLSWKAKFYDFNLSFVELASRINESMPYYVVQQIFRIFNKIEKIPSKSIIGIIGVSFKRDIADIRHSPALKIIELLEGIVEEVIYFDPFVHNFKLKNKKYESVDLDELLENADVVVIITDHSNIDWEKVYEKAKVIFDTRNAIKRPSDFKLIKLGEGSV